MNLSEKLGKKFVITTELGPVKGVFADESLEKASSYLPLDGVKGSSLLLAHGLIK